MSRDSVDENVKKLDQQISEMFSRFEKQSSIINKKSDQILKNSCEQEQNQAEIQKDKIQEKQEQFNKQQQQNQFQFLNIQEQNIKNKTDNVGLSVQEQVSDQEIQNQLKKRYDSIQSNTSFNSNNQQEDFYEGINKIVEQIFKTSNNQDIIKGSLSDLENEITKNSQQINQSLLDSIRGKIRQDSCNNQQNQDLAEQKENKSLTQTIKQDKNTQQEIQDNDENNKTIENQFQQSITNDQNNRDYILPINNKNQLIQKQDIKIIQVFSEKSNQNLNKSNQDIIIQNYENLIEQFKQSQTNEQIQNIEEQKNIQQNSGKSIDQDINMQEQTEELDQIVLKYDNSPEQKNQDNSQHNESANQSLFNDQQQQRENNQKQQNEKNLKQQRNIICHDQIQKNENLQSRENEKQQRIKQIENILDLLKKGQNSIHSSQQQQCHSQNSQYSNQKFQEISLKNSLIQIQSEPENNYNFQQQHEQQEQENQKKCQQSQFLNDLFASFGVNQNQVKFAEQLKQLNQEFKESQKLSVKQNTEATNTSQENLQKDQSFQNDKYEQEKNNNNKNQLNQICSEQDSNLDSNQLKNKILEGENLTEQEQLDHQRFMQQLQEEYIQITKNSTNLSDKSDNNQHSISNKQNLNEQQQQLQQQDEEENEQNIQQSFNEGKSNFRNKNKDTYQNKQQVDDLFNNLYKDAQRRQEQKQLREQLKKEEQELKENLNINNEGTGQPSPQNVYRSLSNNNPEKSSQIYTSTPQSIVNQTLHKKSQDIGFFKRKSKSPNLREYLQKNYRSKSNYSNQPQIQKKQSSPQIDSQLKNEMSQENKKYNINDDNGDLGQTNNQKQNIDQYSFNTPNKQQQQQTQKSFNSVANQKKQNFIYTNQKSLKQNFTTFKAQNNNNNRINTKQNNQIHYEKSSKSPISNIKNQYLQKSYSYINSSTPKRVQNENSQNFNYENKQEKQTSQKTTEYGSHIQNQKSYVKITPSKQKFQSQVAKIQGKVPEFQYFKKNSYSQATFANHKTQKQRINKSQNIQKDVYLQNKKQMDSIKFANNSPLKQNSQDNNNNLSIQYCFTEPEENQGISQNQTEQFFNLNSSDLYLIQKEKQQSSQNLINKIQENAKYNDISMEINCISQNFNQNSSDFSAQKQNDKGKISESKKQEYIEFKPKNVFSKNKYQNSFNENLPEKKNDITELSYNSQVDNLSSNNNILQYKKQGIEEKEIEDKKKIQDSSQDNTTKQIDMQEFMGYLQENQDFLQFMMQKYQEDKQKKQQKQQQEKQNSHQNQSTQEDDDSYFDKEEQFVDNQYQQEEIKEQNNLHTDDIQNLAEKNKDLYHQSEPDSPYLDYNKNAAEFQTELKNKSKNKKKRGIIQKMRSQNLRQNKKNTISIDELIRSGKGGKYSEQMKLFEEFQELNKRVNLKNYINFQMPFGGKNENNNSQVWVDKYLAQYEKFIHELKKKMQESAQIQYELEEENYNLQYQISDIQSRSEMQQQKMNSLKLLAEDMKKVQEEIINQKKVCQDCFKKKDRIINLKNDIGEQKKKVIERDNIIENKVNIIENKEKEIENLNNVIQDLKQSLQILKEDMITLKSDQKEKDQLHQSEISNFKQSLNIKQEKIEDQQNDIQTQKNDLQNKNEQIKLLKTEKLNQNQEIKQLQEKIVQIERNSLDEKGKFIQQIKNLKNANEQFKLQIEQRDQQIKELMLQTEELNQKILDLEEKLQENQQLVKDFENIIDQNEQKITQQEQQIKEQIVNIQDLQELNQQLNEKEQKLQDQLENYDSQNYKEKEDYGNEIQRNIMIPLQAYEKGFRDYKEFKKIIQEIKNIKLDFNLSVFNLLSQKLKASSKLLSPQQLDELFETIFLSDFEESLIQQIFDNTLYTTQGQLQNWVCQQQKQERQKIIRLISQNLPSHETKSLKKIVKNCFGNLITQKEQQKMIKDLQSLFTPWNPIIGSIHNMSNILFIIDIADNLDDLVETKN
ncbi:hypothetical protein PPERSA_09962 [Pseudocohnilembus persalinus]|uniref:Uncharacterized protein n=1 Tax=Pseudocohnilembus persalinus TaxID=266149 RepID=A0A0V0QJC3_PSEPJ|nr:hypothetical protein PPERSA_09962 [Pseudocohnilembus persalinus]|eukprot:KRX02345.1 hypothetical protein PPERSA_09962 [Pseudocohnilembus persalinus]